VFDAECIQEVLYHHNGHLCGYDAYMCANTSIIEGNLDLFSYPEEWSIQHSNKYKKGILQIAHKNHKIISIKNKKSKLYDICGLLYEMFPFGTVLVLVCDNDFNFS